MKELQTSHALKEWREELFLLHTRIDQACFRLILYKSPNSLTVERCFQR